ncbi:MAG: hypothetical protein JSW62_04925, partial [Thermoplasmatales archaeon]
KRAKIKGKVSNINKRTEIEKEVLKQYEDGVKQAKKYVSGVLGGIELTTIRYIIVVTEDLERKKDHDIEEDGVKYKFVNIAVDPRNPSGKRRKQTNHER